ncbi:MAG TPA: aminoacetone oxidase family FAD-binding enzyme [Vicinamibacterales bacterium]|jgi:predicted Rossmann fold flavoprotein|nr:aminoacetone oxidase family FAD-binding enzyme [Vicinamibacterales bacterium]
MPVVVVGAGAAGLVAAIFARRAGRPVVVCEKTPDGGRKILISGGGRCNILPAAIEPERFVTASPAHLVRRVLRSWPLDQQRAFFERDVGTPLVFEAETRKWFPASHRARDVRDGLVTLARRAGVEFRFGCELLDVTAMPAGWRVTTSLGTIAAERVILATGGLSVPSTGSDGAGLRVAANLGHTVHEAYPALTPLVAEPPIHASLSGISIDVRLRARDQSRRMETRGGFLFTHRGYSGPAVLDISHVAVRSRLAGGDRASLRVQWCDHDQHGWHDILANATGPIVNVVARHVPERLADAMLTRAGIPIGRTGSELRRTERAALVEHLTAYPLPWTGDEGYKKAEVTGGGVALTDVNVSTLESRVSPGLYLCGEMLDAFGPIGGFNFAWAWATGRLAGLAAGSLGP